MVVTDPKIHIYCGDGKGKTTASLGLALRMAGAGGNVIFTQFLKDGSSSEVEILKQIPGITYLCCEKSFGFTFRMTDMDRQEAKAAYDKVLHDTIKATGEQSPDLIVLDEMMAVYNAGLIDLELVLKFLVYMKGKAEVVLTGRDPGEELLKLADYVTEMRQIRHPYETEDLPARKGVEY